MDKHKSWLFRFSPEQSSKIGLNLCMYELKVKICLNSSPWDVNSHWVTSIVRICRDTSFAEVNDTSEQSCKVAQLPCATRFPPGCRLCRRQMPNCEGRVPFQYQNDYLDLFVLILFGVDVYFSCIIDIFPESETAILCKVDTSSVISRSTAFWQRGN